MSPKKLFTDGKIDLSPSILWHMDELPLVGVRFSTLRLVVGAKEENEMRVNRFI